MTIKLFRVSVKKLRLFFLNCTEEEYASRQALRREERKKSHKRWLTTIYVPILAREAAKKQIKLAKKAMSQAQQELQERAKNPRRYYCTPVINHIEVSIPSVVYYDGQLDAELELSFLEELQRVLPTPFKVEKQQYHRLISNCLHRPLWLGQFVADDRIILKWGDYTVALTGVLDGAPPFTHVVNADEFDRLLGRTRSPEQVNEDQQVYEAEKFIYMNGLLQTWSSVL